MAFGPGGPVGGKNGYITYRMIHDSGTSGIKRNRAPNGGCGCLSAILIVVVIVIIAVIVNH